MRLALVFCFLTMVGSAAVPAHAQTPTDPSFIIHGSPCVEYTALIWLTPVPPLALLISFLVPTRPLPLLVIHRVGAVPFCSH